jgi:hypothetical protein
MVEQIELGHDNSRAPQAVGFVEGDVADISASDSRKALRLLKLNDLYSLAFVNIKIIESMTYAF